MSYSVAITSAGQMTIPKALRDKFGLTSRAIVEETKDTITIRKEKPLEEALEELYASRSPELKARIEAVRKSGKIITFKSTIEDLEKTPEGRRAIEETYGEKIYAD